MITYFLLIKELSKTLTEKLNQMGKILINSIILISLLLLIFIFTTTSDILTIVSFLIVVDVIFFSIRLISIRFDESYQTGDIKNKIFKL